MIKKLLAYLSAPLRAHVYDFDNLQLTDVTHPSGDKTAALFFIARCQYCGKALTVTRETYILIKMNLFKPDRCCVRDEIIFQRWQEEHIERLAYLDRRKERGPYSFYRTL